VVLGAVVLAVTGAEALYADMGHFGKRSIRIAWFGLVLPSLVLNYFGQGGLILHTAAAAANPFYLMAPRSFLYPLIALATIAAVIASQALISGAFSLTQQCVQLGYSPRVTIIHTSKREVGQIYIPEVNNALMIGCLLVVFYFKSSTALGAAYGIAVTGTFLMTTCLLYVVARTWWGWSKLRTLSLVGPFLIIDGAFFAANFIKIHQGGWVPLTIAFFIFILMTTWNRGRDIVQDLLRRGMLPIDMLLADLENRKTVRVPGLAVFMTREPEGAPVVLLHHLKHNKVLHEQVVLLSILSEEVPEIPDAERMTVKKLPRTSRQFWRGRRKPDSTTSLSTRPSILGASSSSPPDPRRCGVGGRSCSSSCRETHVRQRRSTEFRRIASSSSEHRSNSDLSGSCGRPSLFLSPQLCELASILL
jgi:KUP system potassium uptake protein